MGNRLGIIAGSGELPTFIISEAQRSGYTCVVAALVGEAEASLQERTKILEWFDIDDVKQLISFFKKAGVSQAVFAGKFDQRIMYKKETWGEESLLIQERARTKTPGDLVAAVIGYMAKQGVEIINPLVFLGSTFCPEGILTDTKPTIEVEEDIAFGWKLARQAADLDIGQTVVVKDKAVVAVEGMEGTDEVIKRGGKLAGKGTVVIKVARTQQDLRIDLPAIGLNTVNSLIGAGSQALCFEADRMPFLHKDKAIALADANTISIIAKKFNDQAKFDG